MRIKFNEEALKNANDVINAGLAFANWTNEQKSAMRTALLCIHTVEMIKEDVKKAERGRIDMEQLGERVFSTFD